MSTTNNTLKGHLCDATFGDSRFTFSDNNLTFGGCYPATDDWMPEGLVDMLKQPTIKYGKNVFGIKDDLI